MLIYIRFLYRFLKSLGCNAKPYTNTEDVLPLPRPPLPLIQNGFCRPSAREAGEKVNVRLYYHRLSSIFRKRYNSGVQQTVGGGPEWW